MNKYPIYQACDTKPATMSSVMKVSSPEISKKSLLLSLSDETLSQIFGYVVKHHETIKPISSTTELSKFYHRDDDRHLIPRMNFRNTVPPALDAFNIGLTCKDMYKIIDGDNLFYELNGFEFDDYQTLLDYLKALPHHRRHSIRHVKLWYDPYSSPRDALTILRTLKSLRSFTLHLGQMRALEILVNYPYKILRFASLRGLEDLKLTNSVNLPRCVMTSSDGDMDEATLRLEIAKTEDTIAKTVQRPRTVSSNPSAADIVSAWNESLVEDGGTTALPTILRVVPHLEAFNHRFPPRSRYAITWKEDPTGWATVVDTQVERVERYFIPTTWRTDQIWDSRRQMWTQRSCRRFSI